ncbi:GTPase Era [Candidatus Vidania fulgoroideae]|nr:GTPase Era [Candidatus Vidania fulgoroideae]
MLNILLIGKKRKCIFFIKKILKIRDVSFYDFDLRVFFFQKKGELVKILFINLDKIENDYIEKKKNVLKIKYVLYISESNADLEKKYHFFFIKNKIKLFFVKEHFKNFRSENFFFIKYSVSGFLFLLKELKKNKKEKKKKKIYIPVLGLKNVGKTTLINSVCNKKIFVASKKPGNTKRISTFYKRFGGKIIFFFDFPGFEKKIKIYKLKIIKNFYKKIKIVLFLVSLKPSKKEKRIIERLGKKFIVIICVNKIDTKKKIFEDRIYRRFLKCEVSAKKKTNIDKLNNLIKKTINFLESSFSKKKEKNRKTIKIYKKRNEKILIKVLKEKSKREISKILKIKENLFNVIRDRTRTGKY